MQLCSTADGNDANCKSSSVNCVCCHYFSVCCTGKLTLPADSFADCFCCRSGDNPPFSPIFMLSSTSASILALLNQFLEIVISNYFICQNWVCRQWFYLCEVLFFLESLFVLFFNLLFVFPLFLLLEEGRLEAAPFFEERCETVVRCGGCGWPDDWDCCSQLKKRLKRHQLKRSKKTE